MNHKATQLAAEAYRAAGVPEDHAQDMGKAFVLISDWMNSLPVEEKQKARAWMDERAKQMKAADTK